jgi:ubiquinone/menaquinone biosynthesis C-methylase UbiE
MDYDSTSIPERYRAARDLPTPLMWQWLSTVRQSAPLPPGRKIVDVGCGTGRFSMGLADVYDTHVVGVDRSAKMLAQIRSQHRHVSFCVADAQVLPFRRGSLGMLFLSNVVHHLTDLVQAADGFAHVLQLGGFLVVRNYVREQLQRVPYLEFFPEAYAASIEMLSSTSDIEGAFGRAGFVVVSHRTIEQPVAHSPNDYLEKVRSRTYSDLAAIADDAFEAGIARMTAAVSDGWRRSLREPIVLFSFQKGREPR